MNGIQELIICRKNIAVSLRFPLFGSLSRKIRKILNLLCEPSLCFGSGIEIHRGLRLFSMILYLIFKNQRKQGDMLPRAFYNYYLKIKINIFFLIEKHGT